MVTTIFDCSFCGQRDLRSEREVELEFLPGQPPGLACDDCKKKLKAQAAPVPAVKVNTQVVTHDGAPVASSDPIAQALIEIAKGQQQIIELLKPKPKAKPKKKVAKRAGSSRR